MIDGGFACSKEVILISDAELQAMDDGEWRLLQRMLNEPVQYPGMTVSTRQFGMSKDIEMIIEHAVPVIHSIGAARPPRYHNEPGNSNTWTFTTFL